MNEEEVKDAVRQLMMGSGPIPMFLSALARTLADLDEDLGGKIHGPLLRSLSENCNRLQSEHLLEPMSMVQRSRFRTLHNAFVHLYETTRDPDHPDL